MKIVARQWVRKAENDLAAARQLLKARPLLSDEICFHCQQAIEKYFKALLAEHCFPIQKTHDLTMLLYQLMPIDALAYQGDGHRHRRIAKGIAGVQNRRSVAGRFQELTARQRPIQGKQGMRVARARSASKYLLAMRASRPHAR